jgi:putative restriction endonuclease
MLIWVGVTDKDWFDYLATLQPEEVNFWQPSSKPPTKQLSPGNLFLFKLHSPHNYIVGGGFFVRFASLPVRVAWEVFGRCSGVQTYEGLIDRLQRYRRARVHADAEIGCSVLNAPFFFTPGDWIPIPSDWSPNIVRGKTYATETEIGADLYQAVTSRLEKGAVRDQAAGEPAYGERYLSKARLGQGAFRVLVTDAYHRRCAVTGERTLPVLEAAHIRPYAQMGPNRIENGILLRADIHRLFDNGFVTVDPDLRFIVSDRVREEYANGKEYYRHHGQRLPNLPDNADEQPSRDYMEWHRNEVYLG